MKKRVFVSYTSKDPSNTDEQLAQVEKKLKPVAKVFIDRLQTQTGGQLRVEWERCRCDVLLQLVSSQYKSNWVQKELITARKRGKEVIKISFEELNELDEEQVFLLLEDADKRPWPVWIVSVLSIIVCLIICYIGIKLSYRFVASSSPDDIANARGLFGDSWGGVNAIVSAFAFAGVIVTLFLQNRDLNLQRKEMARQRDEFVKENGTLKYQRFENLFYNMLNLQQRIVDGLKIAYMDRERIWYETKSGGFEDRQVQRVVEGREVFRFVFEEDKFSINTPSGRRDVYGYRGVISSAGLKAYESYWAPSVFDHYFRHFYKILQFVDSQGFTFDEAYKYVSLLRGTLSRYELVWIYYNALQPHNQKLKHLIEKYSVLKNLRPDFLALSLEAAKYYTQLGVGRDDLEVLNLSFTDYVFYLTDDYSRDKYLLSAFWNSKEIEIGKSQYRVLNGLIASREKSVAEREAN